MPEPASASLTQAERTAISDTAMIDAAINLIVSKGSDGATLKALGEASGYSRGLATYRFGNKAGLFKAVIKTVSERWLTDMEAAVDGLDGLPAVIASAEAYLRFLRRSPKDIRAMNILFHLAVEPESELKSLVRRVLKAQREQLARWVQAAQEKGAVDPAVDPDTFAVQYCGYTHGMTWVWMLNSRDIDWERAHTEFIRRLTEDLTPPANTPDTGESK